MYDLSRIAEHACRVNRKFAGWVVTDIRSPGGLSCRQCSAGGVVTVRVMLTYERQQVS